MDFNEYIVIDLETTGLIEKGVIPGIVCYSWCDSEGSGALPDITNLPLVIGDKTPVFHNAKFDVPILRYHGIEIDEYHDSMLMSYVLDTSLKHNLRACAERVGSEKLVYDWAGDIGWSYELAKYAEQDAIATWEVFKNLAPLILQDKDNWNIYSLELNFLERIIEYEKNGLPVDTAEAARYRNELELEINVLKREVTKKYPKVPSKKLKTYKKEHPELEQFFHSHPSEKEWNYQLNELFNYNSVHHKSWILQQEGWKPTEFSKTGTPKLDAAIIASIKDKYPTAQIFQDLSGLHKTLTTFVLALLNNRDVNEFVHTSVNQTVTRTGRLSSSKPNVQNLPSRGETGDRIRSLIKAPKGYVIIGADLSNIEARVLAYYLEIKCHDSYLADVFRSGADFHDTNAASWDLERDMAKKVLYLTLYGGGAQKLADSAGISLAEAEAIFDKFNAALPSVNKLKNLAKGFVEKHGYIRTLLGRHVRYPLIWSRSEEEVAKVHRQSFNALLQGSAADIIKTLSNQVAHLHTLYDVKGLIQVHDENLWLSKNDERVEKFMNEASEIWNSCELLGNLPIVAEFKMGATWHSVH